VVQAAYAMLAVSIAQITIAYFMTSPSDKFGTAYKMEQPDRSSRI
jgi:hypothetical protein